MLFLYLAGVLLWLAYGVLLHAAAMIWANAIGAILVATAVVLKAPGKGRPSADRLAACAWPSTWTK
jgi:hypothetical protein